MVFRHSAVTGQRDMTNDSGERDAPPMRREYGGMQKCRMDAKGRVVVHKDMKNEERLCLTGHFGNHCLVLYPMDEWRRVRAKLDALLVELRKPVPPNAEDAGHSTNWSNNSNNPNVRRMLQIRVLSPATEVTLDANGRVMLPESHRQLARMHYGQDGSRPMVDIVGSGRHVQIWEAGMFSRVMQDWFFYIPDDLDGAALLRHMLERPDLGFLDAWYTGDDGD